MWLLWCEGVYSNSDVQYTIKLICHYFPSDAKSLVFTFTKFMLSSVILLQYDFVVSNYVIYCPHAIHMTRLKMCNKSLESVNGKDIPVQAWTVPEGSRSLRLPGFLDKWPMMAAWLSAYAPAALTPQKVFLVPLSVRGWVDPRVIVRPEWLNQWQNWGLHRESNQRSSAL